MPAIDPHALTSPAPEARGMAPRPLPSHAREFIEICAGQAEAGAFIAARDLGRLEALAARLGSDLMSWAQALEGLDLALQAPLDRVRSGRLLIECVFDEALTPSACRVVSSALEQFWVDRREGTAAGVKPA